MSQNNDLTILGWKFWDLWLQKIFRNVASMKFIWLSFLFIVVVYGMFQGQWIQNEWVAKIPPSIGCSLLGGGFVTLAGTRMYAKTKLRETNGDDDLT